HDLAHKKSHEFPVTVSMRSKEEAHDYRYFPDPDLVPMKASKEWIEEIRAGLPELPDAKRERFISEMGLAEDAAAFLSEDRGTAEWFDKAVELGGEPKPVANWVMGELTRKLNEDSITFEKCPVEPQGLVYILKLLGDGKINNNQAKDILNDIYMNPQNTHATFDGKLPPLESMATGTSSIEATIDKIVKEKGLTQITDSGEIETAVDEVLAANPDEVERFRGGNRKLMGFFVGQVMKATQGKANPKAVNEMIRSKLG
ncbi:MAG TPA: hypothetical protein ENI12_00095, partial [Nitrospirae bacterium]|nr:hypothetical protein [Nitrospirota bacterium]